MEFEFNQEPVAMSKVDVEDIGNFAIEANNDEGFFYYILIKTSLGCSTVCTCGPIIPDVELIPSGFKITLDKMPYKEDKLIKTITSFLNDYKKRLTHAEVVDFDVAIKEFRDISDYLSNYSEEIY